MGIDTSELYKKLNLNPIHDFLPTCKKVELKQLESLECEYVIDRSPNYPNLFIDRPGDSEVIKRLDRNKVLELYPEYEYLYGPYAYSSSEEIAYVFILYFKKETMIMLKVVYATRIFEEYIRGKRLDENESVKSLKPYTEYLSAYLTDVVNPNMFRGFCMLHTFNDYELTKIKEFYPGYSYYRSQYLANKNRQLCVLNTKNTELIAANKKSIPVFANRLLCEIYVAKRRLKEGEVVINLNGKNGDIRIENLAIKNIAEDREALIKEAMDKYGLDVLALENIFARTGYNRFRGIYLHESIGTKESLKDRYYVKLVKNGTDRQLSLLLAKALMCVKENRVLGTDETVDHIDHNKTNDSYSNLRIVPRSKHASDDSVHIDTEKVQCAICDRMLVPNNQDLFHYLKRDKPITCGSVKCRKKLTNHRNGSRPISLNKQNIKYKYYRVNKESGEKIYFDSKDFKECRRLLKLIRHGVSV